MTDGARLSARGEREEAVRGTRAKNRPGRAGAVGLAQFGRSVSLIFIRFPFSNSVFLITTFDSQLQMSSNLF
jgi:hypothetical protein